jgi:MATE family multidrug resistance protein
MIASWLFAGGFMLAFEAGAFDFTTGMAGHLGSPVLTAAHSAMFGFIYLAYCSFPYAIATAATIR